MTKTLSLILTILVVLLVQTVGAQLVMAENASGSAVLAEATPSSSIQSKLDELKKEIASKAAEIKDQVGQKINNKAWAGVIVNISDTQITLDSGTGVNRTVIINEYTDYRTKKKTVKDLKAGDYIVALGDVDDKNNLTAKRIIAQTKADANSRVAVWGSIKSLGASSMKLATESGNLSVNLSGKTIFQLGNADGSWADAKVDRVLVGVGTQSGSVVNADFIFFVSGSGNMTPEKKASIASDSASASPSASPKKK